MAFRNISRNKRRTVLSAVAITLAVIFVCVMKSYIVGFNNNFRNNLFLFETGHIKILNKDFIKEEKLMPLDLSVENYTSIMTDIQKLKYIKAVLPRTKFISILNQEGKLKTVSGLAVDIKKECKINPLKTKIKKGRLFKEFGYKQYEIIIGEGLAESLNLKTGDKITLMAKTAEEGIGHMTFKISGIFSYGVNEIDRNYFIIPLSTASVFLKMENSVGELDVFLTNPDKSTITAYKINRILKKYSGFNIYRAYDWKEQKNGQYSKIVTITDKSYNIIYVVLLILASLVIINTTMMVIYERIKEIGTLASLGMRPFAIVKLFFYEALIISIIGSLAGTIFGGILSYGISKYGIDLAKLGGKGIGFQISNIIYPYFGFDILLFSFLFGVVVSAVCVFIPSLKAARIKPITALRNEL